MAPRIVAFESIYSMDGDFGPLRELCAVAAEYGALTYLDETHAAGAYGHEGAGVAQALGVTDMLTVVQGSLAKGYGSLGGFIVGPASIIDTVRSHASGFIFTTSLPPAIAAAGLASVRHLRGSDSEREALARSGRTLRAAFERAGVTPMPSDSHILPVLVPGRGALPRCRTAPAERACDLRPADQLPLRPARGRAPAHRPDSGPHSRARRSARPGPRSAPAGGRRQHERSREWPCEWPPAESGDVSGAGAARAPRIGEGAPGLEPRRRRRPREGARCGRRADHRRPAAVHAVARVRRCTRLGGARACPRAGRTLRSAVRGRQRPDGRRAAGVRREPRGHRHRLPPVPPASTVRRARAEARVHDARPHVRDRPRGRPRRGAHRPSAGARLRSGAAVGDLVSAAPRGIVRAARRARSRA